MYVFGAILIYTVRFDPFIVHTSNIFAILGLRSMYFLLLQSRLKVIHRGLLGFALVLLSMFFFYFARGSRTLIARSHIAAMSSCSFFCSAHAPPITRLHVCARNAAQLARRRRDPPGVDRGPPVASLFLQSEKTSPALQIRKNSAATSHPPIACGFMLRTRTFPPPMRRHAACSGCR